MVLRTTEGTLMRMSLGKKLEKKPLCLKFDAMSNR